MNLLDLVNRVAEGLPEVDRVTETERASRRTGEIYLPGVKTLTEIQFVEELMDWWSIAHADDFKSTSGIGWAKEVAYKDIAKAKCDLVLCTDGSPLYEPEWGIEFKHISLAGNNGKNNDYNVSKMLSPYLKDRSLMHDILRLKTSSPAQKKAVIGYAFDYSFETCDEALIRHPEHREIIKNLRAVCRSVDVNQGVYSILDLIDFADQIYRNEGLVSPVVKVPFQGAWKHPAGGNGWIFGWEVL